MSWVKLKAPAKVNLTLDVLGKREDGYHELCTVMQTVDLCNIVRLALTHSPETYLYCNNADVPCDHRNLAWKAARQFFDSMGMEPQGLDITLEKMVPMEAGLAGGSADAAAVLVGLNILLHTKLTQERLCEIGAKVGADVPFCIAGGTRQCEGVGERFSTLPELPACWLLLAKPLERMKTDIAFQKLDESTITRHVDPAAMRGALESGDLARIGAQMYNVFEEVLEIPGLPEIKQVMFDYGAAGACMSGTGTAAVGLFANKRDARRCANKLKGICRAVFVVVPAPDGACLLTQGE